jgi:hypothetical protein
MLYDINPADFAHHVRHATSWHDLGVRCGLEKDDRGYVRNHNKLSVLRQKVNNMRLTVDHFCGHLLSSISDDDFKTMVKNSKSVHQVMMKCDMGGGGNAKRFIKRISDLCLDISHFKTRQIHTKYIFKSGDLLDAIDDETFKMLVKDNRTWKDLAIACGYSRGGSKKIASRIEKLGVNTDHIDDRDLIPTDKLFVVDSQYQDIKQIKKRLIRDFDRVYECNACKNAHFTKRDGVLMWNDQEITLQLEHINGVNNDNRPENLCFLCPSCHSQTSTFCGGNGKKYKAGQKWLEEGRVSHPPGSIASLLN